MAQPNKTTYWDSCGYIRRLDPPAVCGALAPSMTSQTNKWLFTAHNWLLAAEGEIDGRVLGGLREILLSVPLFIKEGYALEDGRQFATFTEDQMLDQLGWGRGGAQRLRRGLRIAALTPADADGKKLALCCARLREDRGAAPILTLIERGEQYSHGSVWALEGLEPLPQQPAEEADAVSEQGVTQRPNMGHITPNMGHITPNMGHITPEQGAHNFSVAVPDNDPQDPVSHTVLGGVSPVPGIDEFAALPAVISDFAETAAPPQGIDMGHISPNPANRDTCSLYSLSNSVVCSLAVPERDATNDNSDKKVNEADECFDELVTLFPRGVGKPEFAPKARAAFDALLGKGAAPGAVLERVREVREHGTLPPFPLLILEGQETFADLFTADPQAVMDWAADYGATTAVPAARAIFAARHPGPFGAADLSGEAEARIREIYASDEAGLQRAYALAHAGRAA